MRGVYEAVYKITGLASAKTLMYITAPSSKVVEILEASVTHPGSNVTNQQLEVAIQRVSSLGTPTATSVTPTPVEVGDAAAGSTVKGNVTASEPTYSSAVDGGREGYASLGGWRYQPQPESRFYIAPSGSVGVYMTSTPTSTDTIVRVVFREIG